MQTLGTITAEQIAQTCQKHACKYFYVTDQTGTTKYVNRAAPSKQAEKIAETITTINSVPDQVFKIYFAKGTGKGAGAEYCYYLVKTNAPTMGEKPGQMTVVNTPFEPARSMSEALKDANELATLRAECKRLNEEIERLRRELAAIEEDKEEEKELKEASAAGTNVDKIAGFMKEILPQFMPLADRYFEIADKKLALQAIALQNKTELRQRKHVHPFRPVPTANDRVKFGNYCNWLEKVPENIYNAELEYLQKTAPETYAAIIQEFSQNETEENNA